MRILAVFYLLLSFSLPLCWSYKQMTTRTSPRSPHSITTKNRLCLAHDPTMIYAQGLVNCAVVTVLGIALYFQEKNHRESLAKQDEKFLKNRAIQDAEFRKQMDAIHEKYNNNFGYNNNECKKD